LINHNLPSSVWVNVLSAKLTINPIPLFQSSALFSHTATRLLPDLQTKINIKMIILIEIMSMASTIPLQYEGQVADSKPELRSQWGSRDRPQFKLHCEKSFDMSSFESPEQK